LFVQHPRFCEVRSGQNVNQQHYVEILTKFCGGVKRKWLGLWKNWWILQKDNVPSHNALSVKQFLVGKDIDLCAHPTYSPDLALVTSSFTKDQIRSKRTPF